ncbi:hypothetical protein [Methanothrix soehngenii]|uniref:hypothetical protein n=1 Tax=Methanothrix soehngenii TaxID=2223 RepID=UPI002353ECE4|nr:hypothetical protein [Methanothrix soehngenii]
MTCEIPINLAFEDDLSLEILLRLLESPGVLSSDKRFSVGIRFAGNGYGFLKRNICGFNKASKGMPYLILTDLDYRECAPILIQEWLPETKNPNLIFRIAVREVESWVLADRLGFARFLGIAQNKLLDNPDDLPDPKAHLINLARVSRKRDLREDIVPRRGSTAKQGPAYNERLISFIQKSWNPSMARLQSPSLDRTLRALESFVPQWNV